MEPAREALVRRNTLLLGSAQIALWSVLAVWVAIAPAHAAALAGREYWSGIVVAVYSISAGAGAVLGGRAMDRVGRRPGLVTGYSLMAVAAAGIGISQRSLPGMVLSTMALGAGAGVAHLGRGAVAEMYPAERRARWVGVVLLAGTAGAVGGAPLVTWLAADAGEASLVVWGSAAALALIGMACCAALRPDPRALAFDTRPAGPAKPRRPLTVMFRMRPLIAALATVAVSQAAMTGIMGVSSVVVQGHHGGTPITSAIVVSLHLGAMFAFSPLVGIVLDRWGRRSGLLAGGSVAIVGAAISAFADGTIAFGVGLFLVGLGWSGAYLGATAVVSDVTTVAERQSVLGVVDLASHGCSTLGALAGGFLLDAGGLAALGVVMGAILLPSLVLVAALRESSPGRWAGTGAA